MSLRSKVWVTVGLLCASMAARAEYKEVWNPPEAAQHARHAGHSKHAAAAGSGASKTVHRATSARQVKAAAKPVASFKAKPKAEKTHTAVVKTAHAPVHTTHVEAAAKPHQVASGNAPQAASAQPPRNLPPILH